MKCPHCLVEFHPDGKWVYVDKDVDSGWAIMKYLCPSPSCKRLIIQLAKCSVNLQQHGGFSVVNVFSSEYIRPKGAQRPPPSAFVPKQFAEDYIEACLVFSDSAKASAALSRRCLQHILREVEKVKPADLFSEIQEVLDRGKLPTQIAESIDAIRHIGNFAAHPTKNTSTGEIVPVEPGEAEWNLDVLEALFDYYFVQPALIKKKKDALNAKLKEAGKSPMK